MKIFKITLLAFVVVMAGCTTESAEQKLAKEYEAKSGTTLEINNFESAGTYTFQDSVKYWEGILEVEKAAFLVKMDTAQAHLDRSNKAAKEGLENSAFPALNSMFEQTLRDNELVELKIKINREMAITDGGDTPLAQYYQKIATLKEKGDELIYNVFKGDVNVDGEDKTKFYYFNAENSEIVKAVVE